VTSYLDASYSPRVHGHDIVDDERHPRIAGDIPVLLAPGKAAVTSNFDSVFDRVVAETNWDDMRLAIRTNRGQAPQTLARQIIELRSREGAQCSHSSALGLPGRVAIGFKLLINSRKPAALGLGRVFAHWPGIAWGTWACPS
jgi:hypothetical protein